jgi:L-lactate utilization protein LutB
MSEDIKSKVERAVAEPEVLEQMRAAFRSVLEKREKNMPRMGDLPARKERLQAVRESSVGNEELLERAVENLEAGGVRVRRVATGDEAVAAVIEEMSGEKLLVKSKSNLSKEIGLTAALGEEGVTVVETDIGDRIIQLGGEPSVHPTGPCAQLDRYDVARILSKHLGRDVEAEPHSLIREVLADIVPLMNEAQVGLTGANALTADEGAIVLMHNEGNIDIVSQRPGKLIVLASPEKVYPDIEEALNMLKVEAFHATGQPLANFVRVIGGPSRTADIEKELYLGVHGPREIVVLLIDNGRAGVLADGEVRPALNCVGCGACLLTCPVYDVMGPDYGWQGHLGGVGVSLAPYIGTGDAADLELAVERGLALCTTCGQCAAECPAGVKPDELLRAVRTRAVDDGTLPLEEHRALLAGVKNYSNPWMQPRARRGAWTKGLGLSKPGPGTSLFFAGCSLAYLSKDVAADAVKLLQAAGVDVSTLGKEELCCGSPVLRLGDRELFEKLARDNAEQITASGVDRVITLCPGCLSALSGYGEVAEGFDVPVVHVSQVLAGAIDSGQLAFAPGEKTIVTYHDPCHLGRGCGVFDEPRKLLEAAGGIELVEMERNRDSAACCGSGGGVRTAYPELASEIGRKRCDAAGATGAGVLVTSCPWCEQNLSDAMEASAGQMEVVDICSLLAPRIKSLPF